MSQRVEVIDKKIKVTLELVVELSSVSNHDGFFEGQTILATEEFEEDIKNEILCNLRGSYYSQEFLRTVDLCNYEIK